MHVIEFSIELQNAEVLPFTLLEKRHHRLSPSNFENSWNIHA